jgi:hypothetical protein
MKKSQNRAVWLKFGLIELSVKSPCLHGVFAPPWPNRVICEVTMSSWCLWALLGLIELSVK